VTLQNVHTNSKTRANIHKSGVDRFRQRIGEAQYREIEDWMLRQFDESDWVNTTFVAPRDWSGTPLNAIWEYNQDIRDFAERHRQSAILYGCIFYTVLFDRPENYLFHRPEGHHTDDTTPFGLTYRREA
jgi:hypothetical protein